MELENCWVFLAAWDLEYQLFIEDVHLEYDQWKGDKVLEEWFLNQI